MLQLAMTIDEASARLHKAEASLKISEARMKPNEESKEVATLMITIYYLKGYIQGYCDAKGYDATIYLTENP